LSHCVIEVYSPGNLPNKLPIFIAEISFNNNNNNNNIIIIIIAEVDSEK
jgi:hypothetical protein